MTETSIGYCNGDPCAYLSTDERRWVNWAKRMAKERPNEVTIKSEYKDGTIVACVPISWVKISPPRKCNLSEDERRAIGERLRNVSSTSKNEAEMPL